MDLKDWDNIIAATTGPMTITEFLAAKEKLEDEYLKPCQRCHGNGIDPIKGSIKADKERGPA